MDGMTAHCRPGADELPRRDHGVPRRQVDSPFGESENGEEYTVTMVNTDEGFGMVMESQVDGARPSPPPPPRAHPPLARR